MTSDKPIKPTAHQIAEARKAAIARTRKPHTAKERNAALKEAREGR